MHIVRYMVFFQCLIVLLAVILFFATALPKPQVTPAFSPLVFAHRGHTVNAPENSLAALVDAKIAGAKAVEVDVMLSKDLIPVVIHDSALYLTTPKSGFVKDYSAHQLSQIPLINHKSQTPSSQFIRELEAFIKLAKELNLKLEIELKTEIHNHMAAARAVHALFESYDFYEQGFVSSFDPRLLYYVRNEDPRITTSLGLLKHPPYPFFVNYLLQQPFILDYLGVSIIGPEDDLASESFLKYWQDKNKQINVWTVNSDRFKRQLINMGASVTTDCIQGSC